jgi:hypothetical protein
MSQYSFTLEEIWASIEAELVRQNRPRTRANFVSLFWAGGLPDTWDEECEDQLPPDLRLEEVPDVPIPTTH